MASSVNRRGFLAATGQSATAAIAARAIDVRDHKAVGDGKTDDTAAIQKALDAAARTKGTVHIPEGVFCCSTLKVPPHVTLSAARRGTTMAMPSRPCGSREFGLLPARYYRRFTASD